MATLSTALVKLAEAYEHLLFEGELRRRFSHHMAHVASERWLAVELAMLVNERAAEFGLPGWSAIVEKELVDVALIPPGTSPRLEKLPDDAVRLELKLVSAEAWPDHWAEVRVDLAGKPPKKRQADIAVCFLVNHLIHPSGAWQAPTAAKYRAFHAAIPALPGEFEPIVGEPKLQLLRSSAEHLLEWPHPIYFRWLQGYKARVRILWITEPGRIGLLQEQEDTGGTGSESSPPAALASPKNRKTPENLARTPPPPEKPAISPKLGGKPLAHRAAAACPAGPNSWPIMAVISPATGGRARKRGGRAIVDRL